MSQQDVPSLLLRLSEASLRNAGWVETDIDARKGYLLRITTGVLGGAAYGQGSTENGGDDTALVAGVRKELEAAGATKDTLARALEFCNRLGPAGGKPGLDPHVRTGLLVLLRKLAGSARPGGRGAPPVSLTPALQLGSLPPMYNPAPAGSSNQHQHHQHQQRQYQQRLPLSQHSHNSQNSQQQQQQHPPRPLSAASYAGSLAPGQYAVRPTSVWTPSEMGDDLSAEMSRASLMGTGGGGGGGASATAGGHAAMFGGGLMAVPEPLLVRDVLYAAQGVSGQVVRWFQGNEVTSGFRPDPAKAAALGPGRAMLLERLTELGWLFRRVRQHIAESSDESAGSVRQALGAALAAEVGDFYRLLALLEAQAGLPLPTPGDPGGPEDSGQYLTLRRLSCWLAEPTKRMRLLAGVGDAADGLDGGALAGAVHEYSRHGDPFVAANASKLLQQVCVPLYAIIRRWVLEGELYDQYGEFFVVQDTAAASVDAALRAANNAAAGGGGGGANAGAAAPAAAAPAGVPPALDLWRQSYALEESRLPPFISASLAQRILRAGKAIHYLKLACGDGGWVQQRAEAWARSPPAAAAAAAASGSGELAGLEVLVAEAVRSVDGRLLEVIWRRHRLRAHFAAIRRFLLLGQGDWVTAFMDLAQRELDKGAADVSEVALNSYLRQAFTATNVLGGGAASGASRGLPVGGGGGGGLYGGDGGGGGEEEADDDGAVMSLLAERLRVRKERAAGAGEVGWDVFSLHLNPAAGLPATAGGAAVGPIVATSGGPLSALFTPAALLSYNRLARLLWRLKRAEHALAAAWGAAACGLQRTVDKMGPDGALAQPVLAQLLRLRSDMSHFATNLQYYIQFEVMEASWQDFYSRAASCADLDSLIAAHEAHLATLLRKALLEPPPSSSPSSAAAAMAGRGQGGEGGGATGPNAAALRRALQDALSNMVALRSVAARLEEVVAAGARLLANNRQEARKRVARGGWGVEARAAAAAGKAQVIAAGDLADIRRTLAELRAQHGRAVGEFTENLPEEAQDDVRFLLARLDFSAKGAQAVQAGPGGLAGLRD